MNVEHHTNDDQIEKLKKKINELENRLYKVTAISIAVVFGLGIAGWTTINNFIVTQTTTLLEKKIGEKFSEEVNEKIDKEMEKIVDLRKKLETDSTSLQ